MNSVISLVCNPHETYVNDALEMKRGFYIRKSHTYKNSHQAVSNQLTVGTWPRRPLSLVELLKYHHYITRLILLHPCGSQLCIYNNDCAAHPLFIIKHWPVFLK